MPLQKAHRFHKSAVGPSIIVKRTQDEDTFADFCEYNGYDQWERQAKKHRTDAIYRANPLAIDGFSVPYSLDKKKRWVLPELIEETIEELQDPFLNLRVSASIHTCSRGDSFPPSVLKAREPEQHPTIAYHNVTRSGEVQHKKSRRAELSTLEFAPQPAGNRLNPSRVTPKICLPKEEGQMFQKVHIRYTILQMTERVGKVSKYNRTFRPSLIQRRPKAFPDDLLDVTVDDEPAFFAFDDESDSEGPSSRTLADFVMRKVERPKRSRSHKKTPFCDEELPSRLSFSLTDSSDLRIDDYEVVPDPIRLSLNEKLSISGEERMCSVCCEMKQSFTSACGHSSCSSCWLRYIESAIIEGNCEITCMTHPCVQSLTEPELRPLLSTESFVLVQRFLTDASVKQGRARYCPQCHRGMAYTGKILDACECGARLCGRCSSLFHSPLSCADAELYQQYLKKNGIASLYEITPSITRITDLVRCPGCEVPMQRERGCPSMTCLCGVQFCYKCGKERDGPHNSNACRRRRFETIILMDVFHRSEFSTFHMNNLREAARRRAELNARRREINDLLKCLSTSTKRRILRTLAAMTLLHESSILRSRNNEPNRLKAGWIELTICRFLNTRSANRQEIEEKCTRLYRDLQSIASNSTGLIRI